MDEESRILVLSRPATRPCHIIVEWEETFEKVGLLATIEVGDNGPHITMDRQALPDTMRFLADLASVLGPEQEQVD